jgi:ABC-type multidrug transport system ATPase subunit
VIQFQSASKSYVSLFTRRRVDALSDFSMEMHRGEVVGIAGPNGAGKSTLISLLLGFLDPSGGRVLVDGRTPRAYVEHDGAGYLTELIALPPAWRVPATLQRLAVLAGVPAAERTARVNAQLAQLGLEEHIRKTNKQLSKGNLQRVGLGQALIGDFDLVVLDEPTHGLDPLWTQRFRDIVAELRRPERLILIASHNLDELERLADRVAILNKGRLQNIVTRGAGLEAATPVLWRVVFDAPAPDVAAVLPGATPIEGRAGAWTVRATRSGLSAALARLLGDGAVLVECTPQESTLESAFRAAVR